MSCPSDLGDLARLDELLLTLPIWKLSPSSGRPFST